MIDIVNKLWERLDAAEERLATLEAPAPRAATSPADGLKKALESVPKPRVQDDMFEFYPRFYDWYFLVAVPALAAFEDPDKGEDIR